MVGDHIDAGRRSKAQFGSVASSGRRAGEPLLLAGFDGSTAACHAVAWAVGQARCQRAWLVFVYVPTRPVMGGTRAAAAHTPLAS